MGTAIQSDNINAIDKGAAFSSEKLTLELTNWFDEIKKTHGVVCVHFQFVVAKKIVPILKADSIEYRVKDEKREILFETRDLIKVAEAKETEVKDLKFTDLQLPHFSTLQKIFKDYQPTGRLEAKAFAFDENSLFLSQKEWSYILSSEK